ncbi:YIP1 family protein [Aestuariibius insulae]|uniref:YIP1 family protein n=1 Tax=Aestuariibius insulae TaxID=2058287 RepID=UPI00345E08C4
MLLSSPVVGQLLRETVIRPSYAARRLIDLRLSGEAIWTALALVAVLSVLAVAVWQLVLPVTSQEGMIAAGPMVMGVIVASVTIALAFVIYYLGLAMGGSGGFAAALTLVVWFQFFTTVLQMLQLPIALVTPTLASGITVLAMGVAIWVMVNFVNVLHGFQSLAQAGVLLILAFVGMALGLGFILTLIGVSVPGGAP